jgi:hypothetical protein
MVSDLSEFEVFEVNTIINDGKGSPDRKSDTRGAITIFLGELSEFEVFEVNTRVDDGKRSPDRKVMPPGRFQNVSGDSQLQHLCGFNEWSSLGQIRGFWPESVPLWQTFADATLGHEPYCQIASACNAARVRVWRLDFSKIPSSVLPDDDTPLAAVPSAVLWLFVQTLQNDEDLHIDKSVMVYAKFFFPTEKAPL